MNTKHALKKRQHRYRSKILPLQHEAGDVGLGRDGGIVEVVLEKGFFAEMVPGADLSHLQKESKVVKYTHSEMRRAKEKSLREKL